MGVEINGHTIAAKLRKMFSSSGQTVASNLDGEMPSGGGIVTLYFTHDDSTEEFSEAYKDIAMTEGFSSKEEALAALSAATVVKLCHVAGSVIDSIFIAIAFLATHDEVSCVCCAPSATGGAFTIIVATNDNEYPGLNPNPGPDPSILN